MTDVLPTDALPEGNLSRRDMLFTQFFIAPARLVHGLRLRRTRLAQRLSYSS
jgi:hypothetical protein